MNREDGFMAMGARLAYWVALGIAGFVGAVVMLGRIAGGVA